LMTEVRRSLRWRAKRQFGLDSARNLLTGALVAVQRTDSALRLNVHFHALVLDGVHRHQGDDPQAPLEFLELDAPTHADIAEVAARTAVRVERILHAHGRSLDPEFGDADPGESPTGDEPPKLCLDEPALAGCYAAAAQGISLSGQRAGKPLLRLLLPQEPPARPRASDITDQPIAEVRGINIHAAQLLDGRDRRRVERLCTPSGITKRVKYITRPPVAQDRLP
ncbi:MAG: hypothetical protein GY944_22475, partial [bacterium]|nr:hypothetical protein [bacterium]